MNEISKHRRQSEIITQNNNLNDTQLENLLLKTWIVSKQSRSTKQIYERIITEFLLYNQNKLLKNITVQEVNSFLFEYNEEMSLASKSLAQSVLSSLFSHLMNSGYINKNPVKFTTRIKVPQEILSKTMDEKEVERLIESPKKIRDSLLIKFLYLTGLRVSEVTNLKWSHFKENETTIKISVIGKGNKARIIQISKDLFSELKILKKKESVFVFESQKGKNCPLDKSAVFRIIKSAAKKAKIYRAISPHTLRHTHATLSLKKGAPIHLVKKSLGHSSILTTEKYLHVIEDEFSGNYLSKIIP
jgi:integrase/recombinase XerD